MNSDDGRLNNQSTSTDNFLTDFIEVAWDEMAQEVAVEKEQQERNRIQRFAWA